MQGVDDQNARGAARVLMRLLEAPGPLETPCWVWPGASSGQGYGYVSVRRRAVLVHVLLYRVLVGPVRRGRMLHHLCEVPLCANPAHLEQVTPLEHAARHLAALCPRCERPYDASYGRFGHRACTPCRNERRRALYRERLAA